MNKQNINHYLLVIILQISIIRSFDCGKILYCYDCNTENGCVECQTNYAINENGTCDKCGDLIAGCKICEKSENEIICSQCDYKFEQTTQTKCTNKGCLDSSCSQCTADQFSCTHCTEGYVPQKFYPSYGKEYQVCVPCYMGIAGCKKCSPNERICYECDETQHYKLNSEQLCDFPTCSRTCLECVPNQNQCAKCDKNKYITEDASLCNPCQFLHRSCVECSNWWSCTKCTEFSEDNDKINPEFSCEKCNIPGCFQCNPDGKSCLECYSPMTLMSDGTCSHTNCLLLQNCKRCTAESNSCTQCDSQEHQLVERMNELEEIIHICATCDQIISSCSICSKNDSNEFICQSCFQGYQSLDMKYCLSECGLNQIAYDQNQKKRCLCSELFYFNTNKNQCASQCPEGQLGNYLDNMCIPSKSCTGFISSDNKRCLDQCPMLEIINQSNQKLCQKQTTLSLTTLSKALTTISNINTQSRVTLLSDYIDTALVQDQEQLQLKVNIYQLLQQSVHALQNEISKISGLQKIERQSDDYAITIISISETYRFNCLIEIDENQNIISSPYLFIQEHSKCNEIDSDTLSIIISKQSKEFISSQDIAIPYIQFGLSSSDYRFLEQSSTQFKVNIPVNATNNDINKFWCITMSNNQPQSSTKSILNPNNSTITCQFVNNTSIIYDEKCEYVNSSFCSENNQNSKLSALTIVFIVIFPVLGIACVIILYIFIKRRRSARQLKYERASTLDIFSESDANAVN